MVNRNPCSQWFITFPQWEDYNDIKVFEKVIPSADWGYVVKESHENGGIHYHVICRLKKAITKSNLGKWFEKKFPNEYKRVDYEPVKALKAAIDYLDKEQLEVYEWGVRIKLPGWMQVLKDDWCSPEALARYKIVEEEERLRHNKMLLETWEKEHPRCIICLKRNWNCDYCNLP